MHARSKAIATVAALLIGACGSPEVARQGETALPAVAPRHDVRIPRAPGVFSPSLVSIAGRERPAGAAKTEISEGAMLSDVDSCATCHPDVSAQWSSSAHSFASFGNPIYRFNVELARASLGKDASRHCGGCHDMPLMVDGLMTGNAPVPPDDLRAHSGVTCRLCHAVQETTHDGNGSYVWNATPLDAPSLDDPGSIARHKQQVTTKVDTELCVGCHRGFLSPDMQMPVHLTGIDEPGAWRNSAYTGNGLAQIDQVERQNCLDCHMERVPSSPDELGAKQGTVASHRFVGGHTWMASMRGDAEQLRLTRAKLEGAASIDVAGARVVTGGKPGAWHLPADGAPVIAGTRLELDVVIRNLLAGHRFPGGVLDIQDTWIEVELVDRNGKRIAANGLAHATNPRDTDSHVLRTLVVDDDGNVLEHHEMAKFRTQVTTKTLAAREGQAVRYAFAVPARVAEPVTVTARLRHRSRTLQLQEATCKSARTAEGAEFLAGARGARDVTLDPCAPQPITLVAQTQIQLGRGARSTFAPPSALLRGPASRTLPSTFAPPAALLRGPASRTAPSQRPVWQRLYEHGMALVQMVVTRVEDARAVLDAALAAAPDDRARAMVNVQLGWLAAKQGRVDDAAANVARARALLPITPAPAVFDAVLADAYVRQNRWHEAVAPAKACTERAPRNANAWSLYARVLVAVGDHEAALAAAVSGLELAPRDPDLLRSQATSLAALESPLARAAHTAYVRFRSPDEAATLRIRCAQGSARCWRDRNPVQTLELK
jgi:Tfp pilus assembly protein PilF